MAKIVKINVSGYCIGSVIPFAGTDAPIGTLLCYGQAISRTTYSRLFVAINTTYGVGDGSTTFNLPDLRGRTVAGKDDMGGSAANRLTSGGSGITGSTLGNAGGSEVHTLTTAQLASHNHTLANHTHSGTSGTESVDHTHGITPPAQGSQYIGDGGGGNVAATAAGGAWASNRTFPTITSGRSAAHTHSITTGGPSNNTSDTSGSGTGHQNTQPTIVHNYVIAYI